MLTALLHCNKTIIVDSEAFPEYVSTVVRIWTVDIGGVWKTLIKLETRPLSIPGFCIQYDSPILNHEIKDKLSRIILIITVYLTYTRRKIRYMFKFNPLEPTYYHIDLNLPHSNRFEPTR